MSLVVDASIACKWLIPEPDSAIADRVTALNMSLIAPMLIVAECGNIFWRKHRIGEITTAQAMTSIARLPGYFAALHPEEALRDRALAIAMELDHPIYDAFYVALAERADCPVVTLDGRLTARVQGTPWQSLIVAPRDLTATM